MFDKILGILVWHGGRLYLRRWFARVKRRAIVAGLGAAVIAGVIVVQRRMSSSS